MTTAPFDSVPFSELLRQPTETAERVLRTRAVRLRRRDAADLVLMSADRADAEGQVVDITARLLATLVSREPELIRDVLPTVLPWVKFLPAEDVDQLASEFVSTAEAAASIGNTAAISQLLTEWRHTAEIHADRELYQALVSQPLDDFGAVPRP